MVDGFRKTFTVLPVYTPGKHWVAVAERSIQPARHR